MTREEIVKALRCCNSDDGCRGCPLKMADLPQGTCVDKVLFAAADMLEQDAQEWISVKDRLPSRGGRYLVAVGNDFDDVCIAEYDGKEFGETVPEYDGLGHVFEDWDAIKFATHWAEMPEPPKEDEE